MAGKNPAYFTPRDESAHPVVEDAIRKGYVTTQGRDGRPYVIRGFKDEESAQRGRRSVYNAARHFNVSCSSRTNEDVIAEEDGTFTLRFWLIPKNAGRKHVIKATGGDPSKLAYNPFAKKRRPLMDDDGQIIPLCEGFKSCSGPLDYLAAVARFPR